MISSAWGQQGQNTERPRPTGTEPQPAPEQTIAPNTPPGVPPPPVPPQTRLEQNAAQALKDYYGRTVTSIEFTGSKAVRLPERLLDFVPQKVGEPLDRQKLRNSIRELYATGRFQNIGVTATESGAGVALEFQVEESYFVGIVRVAGAPNPPNANQLVNATKLELGEAFSEEQVSTGIGLMQRTLQENGYYRAQITPSYDFNAETQQADITLTVQPGEQARVGAITITGEPGYSHEEIEDIAKFHSGDRITSARVTRALQRLRKKYQKKDRLEAQVSITDRTYQPSTNTVDYTFKINRGPQVEIEVEGANVRSGLIKRYVPVYEENAVDDDLLNEGRRNLRDYFQTRGYFDVDINFTSRNVPNEDKREVVFTVNRGERHKIADIAIEGNKYFSIEDIRERMEIQPASTLITHGRFSQSMLARDVESIENLYRANGFLTVDVQGEALDSYQGDHEKMAVRIRITEGPQSLVKNLTIEGNQEFDDDRITEMLTTQAGQPYSDLWVTEDREKITNMYYNSGFPEVQVEAFSEPSKDEAARMNVTFRIREGQQRFVDRVLISGLENTRRRVVNRELAIRREQPVSQAKMLESQSGLYDLGIFNQVQVAVQNPEGDTKYKNVLFQLEEAKRYTLSYGFGLEVQTTDNADAPDTPAVSPRVSFDVTRLNFRGLDHTISFKSRLGRLQQRALISYEAPYWFGRRNWTMTFTTFYDSTSEVTTFRSKRLEGSIQAQQIVNRGTTMLYRFTYRRVRADVEGNRDITQCFDATQTDCLPLLSLPVRVGIPSVTFIRDTRDDPIQSTRGNLSTIDAGASWKYFGSEADFGRLLGQNSSYYAFGQRSRGKARWVFARSTRLGGASPFGENQLIPLPERFFVGGGNSHRGFAINQAGPRDSRFGLPVGGEALLVNNLELRTPPIELPFIGDNLSAVLFHDMGNAFNSVEDMVKNLVNFKQDAAPCQADVSVQCDFSFVSHAVGLGLRYRTPIGPVRVDLGYNLNPPFYTRQRPDDATQRELTRLKRFNFFFSIGQTF